MTQSSGRLDQSNNCDNVPTMQRNGLQKKQFLISHLIAIARSCGRMLIAEQLANISIEMLF